MPQNTSSSSSTHLMKPLVVLALPGMYLLYKYNQYRQQQMETARRRVTERELMHLNTKIKMFIISQLKRPCFIESAVKNSFAINGITNNIFIRGKKYDNDGDDKKEKDKDCKMPEIGPPCECVPLKPKPKKETLWKMGLRFIDGGTNFGAPLRRLFCKEDKGSEDPCHYKTIEPPNLPMTKEKKEIMKKEEDLRVGVQVALLSADTDLGQYLALLLKQCPIIRRLQLYGAYQKPPSCTRDVFNIARDLELIDTSTVVGAFSTVQCLGPCLNDSNIVVILDSGAHMADRTVEGRFRVQAPTVMQYAENIACACPDAFVLCCAHPVDCLVPLIAEVLDSFNCYGPSKLMGSLAVPEMRASTVAARVLTLSPEFVKVPCVGGTEGNTLVPLFSKAIESFHFCDDNCRKLTNAIRNAEYWSQPDSCMNHNHLCQAHALFGVILKIANGLMNRARPVVTGFVQNDFYQVIYPNKFMANPVELGCLGIMRNLTLPKMSVFEQKSMDEAMLNLNERLIFAHKWYYTCGAALSPREEVQKCKLQSVCQ